MKILELFGAVGEKITVEGVKSFLNANKSNPVQFDISSLGGDLDTAITIHSLIQSHPYPTTANIVGLTASAGTVIASGCDERLMSDNALYLVHNGLKDPGLSNIYDIEKTASVLMKTDAIMTKIYREVTGMADDLIKSLMKASDWLSPDEALNYGFVTRIISSGTKIAASVLLESAQGKMNNELLIKLKEKMKIFGSGKKPDVLNVLSLKDGRSVLINAVEPATGVEVAPVGAMTLEDGTYELADGRKITCVDGMCTEVTPAPAPASPVASDAIVEAVGALVVAEIAKVRAEFTAALGKISSTHKPAKGVNLPGSAAASAPDVNTFVKAITDGIFQKIYESRKA